MTSTLLLPLRGGVPQGPPKPSTDLMNGINSNSAKIFSIVF
jgi:hypothetical protein